MGDLHVDIVSNRVMAGECQLLATVLLCDGVLSVEPDTEYNRGYIFRQAVKGVDPVVEPNRYLEALWEQSSATYVFASKPHDPDDCPFLQAEPQRPTLAMSKYNEIVAVFAQTAHALP
jgi:hypothetical protein